MVYASSHMVYENELNSSSEAEYMGFEFSTFCEGASIAERMLSADELFCDGKLRPLSKMHEWWAPIKANLLVEEVHFERGPFASDGLCFSSPSPTSCSLLSHGQAEEKGRKTGEWGSPRSRPALLLVNKSTESVGILEMGSNASEWVCLSPAPTACLGAEISRKAHIGPSPFTDAERVHFVGDYLQHQMSPDKRVCLAALPTSSSLLFPGQEAEQIKNASFWGSTGNSQALLSVQNSVQGNVEVRHDVEAMGVASCSGLMNTSRGGLKLDRSDLHSSEFASTTSSSAQASLNSAASFSSFSTSSFFSSLSSSSLSGSLLASASSLSSSSSSSSSLLAASSSPLVSSSSLPAVSSSLPWIASTSLSPIIISSVSSSSSSTCLNSPSSPPFSALPLPSMFLTSPSSPPFSALPLSSSSLLTSPSSPPFSPLPSLSSSFSSSCSLSPSSSSSSLSKDGCNTREHHSSSTSHMPLSSEQSIYTSCSCRFPLRSLWPFSKSKERSYSCIKSSHCISIKPQERRRKSANEEGYLASKNQCSFANECQVSSKIPTLYPLPSPISPCKSPASEPSRGQAIPQSRHMHAIMLRSNTKHSHKPSKHANSQLSKDGPTMLVKDEQRRSRDDGGSSPPIKKKSPPNAYRISPTHTERSKKISSSGGKKGLQVGLGAYASRKGAYTPSVRVTPVLSIVPGCMGPSLNKTRSSFAKPPRGFM